MEENKIPAIKIFADCVETDDWTYNNYHGLRYYGYHFVVRKEEKEEMKKFVEETIKSNGIPLVNIGFLYSDDCTERNIDTKEDIVREVLEDKEFLLEEYKRYLEECNGKNSNTK